MKNYYQILGVSASATKEDIKEAYVKLSKKIHPDMNSGDNFFTELFKSINEAYQVLFDDDKRSSYNIKFNSYLYDFNYVKEKEVELQRREANLNHRGQRRKLFFRSFFTLLAGMTVVAVFTFAFDRRPYEEETTVVRTPKAAPATANVATEEPKAPETIKHLKKIVPQLAVVKAPAIVQVTKPAPLVKTPSITQIVKPVLMAKKAAEVVVKKEAAPAVASNTVSLSEYNMSKIVADLMKKRLLAHNSSNCVKLIKTETSNIENAFKLAQVLRIYGFVLAGRETTSKNIKGIQIDCSTNFITIVMGTI